VPLLLSKHSGNGKLTNQKLLPMPINSIFCDEFTNYYDVSVGIDAFELLSKLGYEVSCRS
jgi:Fe-S oxidoreductase